MPTWEEVKKATIDYIRHLQAQAQPTPEPETRFPLALPFSLG